MSGQCSDDIERIANRLGFSCEHAAPVVHLRNPFDLANWTLPVLELTVVAGAVLALWWAIRRLRRDGDPVNLVIWFSTVIYLLIVEPPLYFPTAFGVDDTIGAVFAHNVFTVEFMYDRLPLYIVALYPAMMMLAYEIVRSLGVFRDRGAVIGAVCVGFVHHCFYEIFDQLGPQLRWWAWNTDNAINRPMLASVPMSSVLLFATVGPALVAFFTQLLVVRPHTRGQAMSPTALVLRTFGVAALIPVGLVIANAPILLAGVHHPNGPLRWAVYVLFLALFTVLALPVLLRQWRTAAPLPGTPNPFVRAFGPMFLVVIGALWLTALPANLNASDGITADGTPTGNAAYAAACFLLAVALTMSVSIRAHTTAQPADVSEGDSQNKQGRGNTMTDLEIRRIHFDLDGDVPFNWNAGNPAFSTYMNMVSIMAICFEKMIVAAVREAMPLITDTAVAEESDAFLRQEAQHASAHRQHLRALIRRHPGLQETLDEAVASYDHLTATTPLNYRLAYIADLEATFTPFFKMLLDNEATLFQPGDERVASLLMWHFVEEVEHRSSALIIFDAVVDDKLYRMRALPRVIKHLMKVSNRVFEGINAHVPQPERGIDARDFVPLSGLLAAIRHPATARDHTTPRARPALHTVPWKQKLTTAARVLMSQTPFHDPAKEPLPEFAHHWFERYDRGDDVCHWYSAQTTSQRPPYRG